jgi:phytoene synthase
VSAPAIRDNAYSHCETLVREADKDRYVASLFAPADRRPHLYALYACNLEIARIAEVVHEPLAGEVRLQWWHDVLTGEGDASASGHPVATAVLDTLDRCRLSAQPLLDLIDARRFDIYREPMASEAEFDAYVRKTSSGLFATAVRILGRNGRDVAQAADAAGLALGTAVLLAAAPLHAARGRVYLPLEVLARHEARAEDLLAGRMSPALAAVFSEMAAQARRHLDQFLEQAEQLPPGLRPAFLPVAIVPLLLRRLRRISKRRLDVIELPPVRRLAALLRAGWFGFPTPR